MRITLISHYYEPEVGAPQRRWSALVPRLVAAGHQVNVLVPQPHYPSGQRGQQHTGRTWRAQAGRHGETVVRLPFRPYGAGARQRLLDQVVSAAAVLVPGPGRRGDVIIASAPGLPTLAAGTLLSRATRTPLVIEMRDAWPDLIADSGLARGRAGGALGRLVTTLQRRAAAVVTVTDSFGRVLADRGVRRVVTVRGGVSLDQVPVLHPVQHVEDLHEGVRPLRVLYLGTVGQSQGLDSAVRAAASLGSAAVRLTVIGEGAKAAELAQAAAALRAPVEVLPAVAPDAVWRSYTAADTCLMSLQDWPAFAWTVPSKLYELLAAGRHISAAVTGEAADLVRAAGGGDVVAPQDDAALAGLWAGLAQAPDRLLVGGKPRQWVARNADYYVLAERYLTLLHEVCDD